MYSFLGKLIWWHWHGGVIPHESINALAKSVRELSPNASGIAIKTSNGTQWQGDYNDPKPDMAVHGVESIRHWVDTLAQFDLETHLWCVLHGHDVEAEAQKVIDACNVDGVSSMILDVEAGDRYFGSHPPETAKGLIAKIRAGIEEDFHLGLCLFTRNSEPDKIHIHEWLPFVQSLHPMVYHWDFSEGTSRPEPYLAQAFQILEPYQLPINPILGAYPDPTTGMFPPPEHLFSGGQYALELGAEGLSVFRLGDGSVIESEAFSAISRIKLKR